MRHHTPETWRLAESTSYHYQEMLRRPGDERVREQYEWIRDQYLAATAKEKKA